MQPSSNSWSQIKRIAQKETTLFFTSPVAYLFLAAFAGVSLFVVFWGEAFFARNIADVRPLFEWMPILLIFLCSALTMRLWSEERRAGTLEHILTSPVPIWRFVVGKFLACLALLSCALIVTFGFPVTVSLLGDLDWGPVFTGYLATMLLGAAYLAIGLFVSSRSSNQIVSLLGSISVCGTLYLIGSPSITELFSQQWSDYLRLLGTGARFESITRGVIDIRNLAYYVGLILTFLSLNAYLLETERWTHACSTPRQKDWKMIVGLIVANALGLNLWVGQLAGLRLDVTEGQQYTLSQATQEQIQSLREPLIVKAFFSQKTHPLLAPLIPQLRDLLKEYEEESGQKVRVEFIDPQQDPEAEQEAKQEYGLEPVPFQMADRYEASIVSSYFNLVINYGDSFEVLGFQDLIEVKGHAADNIDVQLRNPEYDITRAIKKTVDNYQKEGQIFDSLSEPVTLQLFLSEESKLPEKLTEFRGIVQETAEELQEKSNGKLAVETYDPDTDNKAKELAERYGLRPMAQSLTDQNRFYFYMVIGQGDKLIQITLDDLSKVSFERNFDSALKRFGSGFAKTVALVSGNNAQTRRLQEYLGEELNIEQENLSDGSVSGAADVLLMVAPEELKAKELYAVDQFLMRGGTVVAFTSPFKATMGRQSLSLEKKPTGLEPWFKNLGIEISENLVLDSQCAALPIPVTRSVGGFQMQEIRLIDYPYFVDVRSEEIEKEPKMLADIGQLTVPWTSPISYQNEGHNELTYHKLFESSSASWLSPRTDVMPQIDAQGRPIILPMGTQESRLLGLMVSGQFDSYFATDEGRKLEGELEDVASATVEKSPETAKLILVSSPSMLNDEMVRLFSGMGAGDALGNLNMVANMVDWATLDESLLGIRSRSHFKRTLYPLDNQKRMMWEYLNYFMALIILAIIGAIYRFRFEQRKDRYRDLMNS
jgi:gliding motility-associated transport system permease protein/gliding motility-associatede transport system auxiliary component